MILSLYARGLSTRDIETHLLEIYGVAASRELISNVTDVVTDDIEIWRNRPVDEVYPIVYIDGIRLKVRDKGAVTIKVAHLAVGVDVEGRKHALGVWIAEAEGAKFWPSVLTQLRNRGLRDILIACCDGLSGLLRRSPRCSPKRSCRRVWCGECACPSQHRAHRDPQQGHHPVAHTPARSRVGHRRQHRQQIGRHRIGGIGFRQRPGVSIHSKDRRR